MRKVLALVLTIILIMTTGILITGCSKTPDYTSAAQLENALNSGEDVTGKIAVIVVDEYNPNGSLGYTIWAGEHLNLISSSNPKVKEGDEITIKIKEVKSLMGSWILEFKVV